MSSGRDAEVREVVAELNGLLDELRENVAALSSILAPPAAPPGPEQQENAHEPA